MSKYNKETFGLLITSAQAEDNYGFVYIITVKGKSYIGAKSFDKGLPWQKYTSSSKYLNRLINENPGRATFQVLELAKTKRELTYLEVKYQMKYEVLEHDEFINENVLGKFFKNVRFNPHPKMSSI